jgi:two-component system, NarL family, sensor histidine kinase DesK
MAVAAIEQPRPIFRARLFTRRASRWYAGTVIGLAYQVIEIVSVWTSLGPVGIKIAATLVLAVFYVGYIAIPPLVWNESVRVRLITIGIYWIASFALVPLIGDYTVWVWPLVVAMIAFSWLPTISTIVFSAVIVVAQILFAVYIPDNASIVFAPFVTVTVLVSLLGITRQIVANQRLRDAQATIATLAAAEERARLARDLHDVLGHSLTVVAVKSELAGRLVDLDPKRAIAEISDIETLARTALADLRAAVTTYREVSLDTELRAARTALTAAGIEPHLPEDGGAVAPELRPLFGWVLREGVTNVIRHSKATACWVELEPHALRVRDDGTGAFADGSGGNGLTGLRERAREAGAELTTAANASGGFVLTVERSRR